MANVKKQSIFVGKKTIMDLLAKSFHNASIKPMIEVFSDIMK
jgi:hypothetical protein